MTQYRILIGQQEYGPYSDQQLKSMYASGSITMDALYWTDGMEEWRPVTELALGWQNQNVPPPIPLIQPLRKKKTKGDLISTLAKALCVIFGFGVIISIIAGSSNSTQSANHQTPTAADKARSIVAGSNPVMASTHKGFLTIDRAITNDYPPNNAPDNAADLLLSAVVVNKLLSAIPEQELINIYTEWCKQTGHATYSSFPEFLETCKKGKVKGMADSITKDLTK